MLKSKPWKLSLALAVAGQASACTSPYTLFESALVQLEGSTQDKSPTPPPSQYRRIHERAPAIIDMHADTLVVHPEAQYLDRLLVNGDRLGQVDVPRLIEGNVALQVFAAYSKGSLDVIGNQAPAISGTYMDAQGDEHSRYDFVRDPDVPEYDDPQDPYDGDYLTYGMPRDVMTYAFRISRDDARCETWYDNAPWDSTLWGSTPACPGFDYDRMYLERLLDVNRRLEAAITQDSRLRKVTNLASLDQLLDDRTNNPSLVGALLSTEGLYFRSDVSTASGRSRLISAFSALHGAGFRMFGLTHFIDNDHGGSSTGMGKATFGPGGRPLSDEGELFARLALLSNSVVDVAHASENTISALTDIARSERKPLVYSHGGLQNAPQLENDHCASSRNLSDAKVLDIVSTGGVIGIGFAPGFVCGLAPLAWASAVRHAVDLIDDAALHRFHDANEPLLSGVEHVGVGSDYDGGIEAYTDIANLNQYTEALTCTKSFWKPDCLERPFTEAEAHKILGLNTLRVLREVL